MDISTIEKEIENYLIKELVKNTYEQFLSSLNNTCQLFDNKGHVQWLFVSMVLAQVVSSVILSVCVKDKEEMLLNDFINIVKLAMKTVKNKEV